MQRIMKIYDDGDDSHHNKKDECAAHTVSIRLDLSQHALVQQPLLQVTVERAGL